MVGKAKIIDIQIKNSQLRDENVLKLFSIWKYSVDMMNQNTLNITNIYTNAVTAWNNSFLSHVHPDRNRKEKRTFSNKLKDENTNWKTFPHE